jgi:hypothetical protein
LRICSLHSLFGPTGNLAYNKLPVWSDCMWKLALGVSHTQVTQGQNQHGVLIGKVVSQYIKRKTSEEKDRDGGKREGVCPEECIGSLFYSFRCWGRSPRPEVGHWGVESLGYDIVDQSCCCSGCMRGEWESNDSTIGAWVSERTGGSPCTILYFK